MRLFKDRFAISSRLKVKKEIHRIISEHFHREVPKYDIDIDFLPRINFAYYGRPGNCYWGLTCSWIVWDLSFNWESNGLPPKIKRKQSYRR